jgi:aspartate aminotransferase-like enzyme
LVGLLAQYFRDRGFDLAIISGTVRQLRLYKHLGFVTFGPVVGTGEAQFQPMYLTLETFIEMAKTLSPSSPAVEKILASYLPGPVEVHEEVRKAFERGPVSHRSDTFTGDFRATKKLLCDLTCAARVEILLGSGSLANDAVGGQISLLNQRGILLSNGEFGDRLIDHATRLGLHFDVYQMGWGEPFDYAEIRRRIRKQSLGWMWATHCETSTGILNDLGELKRISAEHNLKLCLDCISSIGTVPVDLTGVYLSSCVSGKGLAAFPGLSMVFYHHDLQPAPNLTRYLDLGYYAAQQGIPFTHSSNLIHALQTSLKRTPWTEKFGQIRDTSKWLCVRLRELGFQIVAPEGHASPAVITLALAADLSSKSVGWQLQKAGYLLSYKSDYLLRRNWIQVCLMGEWTRDHLAALPDVLVELAANQRRRKTKRQLQTAV